MLIMRHLPHGRRGGKRAWGIVLVVDSDLLFVVSGEAHLRQRNGVFCSRLMRAEVEIEGMKGEFSSPFEACVD
jgi:hypothetical protein